VRRLPLVVVAVLIATTLMAALLRGRVNRVARERAAAASARSAVPSPAARQPSGLGVGVPPAGVEVRPGAARMLHGDARHTNRAVGRIPAARPALVWSRDVGGPIEGQVVASPDEQSLYASSLGGTLTALAREDGAVKWTFPLGDRSYGTPCVGDDGTIYIGSDAKKLFAVGADGKLKWTLETEGDADTSAALAKDGTIVFAAGRMVYGVTPLGYVKWRFAAKRKVFSSPAIATDGRVFFGSQDHHAYALSPDGKLAWSVDLGADVDGAPAVGEDGAVFFGTDGDEVVRLEASDGRVAWRARVGGYVRGPISVARDGSALAGVYGPVPREVRLRSSDGGLVGELSIQGTGAREFGIHGGALEDEGGAMAFGAQDDAVYAVGATGEALWSFATGGDVDPPVTLLGDGTLVFGSDDGLVYALRPR